MVKIYFEKIRQANGRRQREENSTDGGGGGEEVLVLPQIVERMAAGVNVNWVANDANNIEEMCLRWSALSGSRQQANTRVLGRALQY